jgi:putative hydrolase of the HAD superfamily
MIYYKHYSFDLWLTLIKSNLEFKTERTKIFHQDYNPGAKSIDEVANAFRQVDLMCNRINEATGKNIDSDEMYLMVISLITDNKLPFCDIDTCTLNTNMENLLLNHMPVLYEAVTIDVLDRLKQMSGSTFSLLSNTGFVKGQTLRKILTELNIDKYFDFQLFSDEAGMSKPNPLFFDLMLKNIDRVNQPKKIALTDIIHIGDNPTADIKGAKAAGVHSLLINSNNKSITSLINR